MKSKYYICSYIVKLSLQMKDRIILLIKAKNLTAAQFADEINVQKSSISHIISGRNNASLDFIQKILFRYPDVNMDWLMFGKGPIFKEADIAPNNSNNEASGQFTTHNSPPVDLFSEINPGRSLDFRAENKLSPERNSDEIPKRDDIPKESAFSVKENKEQILDISMCKLENVPVRPVQKNTVTKSIVKIVEFYSDNTYKEYFPE